VENEPNWETEELEGFEDVLVLYEREWVTTKIYTRGVTKEQAEQKRRLLQRCYDLLSYLRMRVRVISDEMTDDQLDRCVQVFTRANLPNYVPNPVVTHLRSSDHAERVGFVRNGLRLFLRTRHTIQELNPGERYFRAVNKPHAAIGADGRVPPGPSVDESEPFMGNDERLRAFDRHIVINLSGTENMTMCLLIHELAHTPPNHVCFRHDDHNDDFLFFQWLFLNMAQRAEANFVTKRIYV
jgi:hypothetical protein